MINKTLHYVWIGGSKPDRVVKCINSFHKFLPDFNIIEWNESNIDLSWFDSNLRKLYEHSYKNKKYAFCTDIARLYILKNFGGIFSDADVEFIKSIPDFFLRNPFISRISPTETVCNGCLWYCDKDDKVVLDCIKLFDDYCKDNLLTYGKKWIFNTLLKNYFDKNGDTHDGKNILNILGYNLYPSDYFCPKQVGNKDKFILSDKTITIHHFNLSWM